MEEPTDSVEAVSVFLRRRVTIIPLNKIQDRSETVDQSGDEWRWGEMSGDGGEYRLESRERRGDRFTREKRIQTWR